MKLTTFLLLIALIPASAKVAFSQITLNEKNANLDQVVKAIEKQSAYVFLYDADLKLPSISVSIRNASIEETLTKCFNNLPVTFSIEGNNILLKGKENPTLLDKIRAAFNAIDVHGKVLDAQGIGLPGVTVKLKDNSQATITDAKGEFTLKHVDENAVLVLSFIGYTSQEIAVKSDLSAIRLAPSDSKLDEVKVIAYGKTTDRTSVGNVSVVSAKDIEIQPVNNPLVALIGRVPGLLITQNGGYSGQAVTVQIQGQNSISNGNDPFYVVDGAPFLSSTITSPSTIFPLTPFSLLNPNDIESITVLKDADATAIYGSRAANGAILITTKKGRFGATKVEVRAQQGYAQVSKELQLMNTEQYLNMRKEGFANLNLTPTADPSKSTYAPDLTLFSQSKYTDWQKELTGKMAQYTDINPSISGGTEFLQFRFGATYHRETTVYPTDLSDRKAGVQFSLNSTSQNRKFKFGLQSNFLIDDNRLPTLDLAGIGLQLAPNAPDLYNADGSLNWALNPQGSSMWSIVGTNPVASLQRQAYFKSNNIMLNSNLSYEIIPGLQLGTTIGYNLIQSNLITTDPLSAYSPEQRASLQRGASFNFNKNYSLSIEPQLNYARTILKGKFNLLLGASVQQSAITGYGFSASGQPSDDLLTSISSATNSSPGYNNDTHYRYNAGFGRLSYIWDDKYILNANLRRDGSSRFGPENRFHNFWSTGAAWVFTEEKWLKEHLTFLSFGKLSANYGTTGSDQIADYSYLSLYYPLYSDVAYQNGSSLYPASLSNPYLQWEETTKLNFGLNMSFVKDRISFTANYFRNRTGNQLQSYALPILTGFLSVTRNFPALVQNTGWELSLNTQNVRSKGFNWTTSFNITVPHNKLLRYDGLSTSTLANSLIIGQSISINKRFQLGGVNAQTGRYYFIDRNGKQSTNPSNSLDKIVIIDMAPKFYGGLSNHLSYQGISLDFTFSFRKRFTRNYSLGIGSLTPGNVINQPTYLLDRWQKPGDITNIARFSSNNTDLSLYSKAQASNAAYTDVFYARLSNASISWSFPEQWTQRLKMTNAALFINGENLFILSSRYVGQDPETGSIGMPPLRVLTAGIKASF